MEAQELSADVVRFVTERLDSVAELEALLLMQGEAKVWDTEALARRLYISPAEAGAVLEALTRHGLAAADGQGFRFYAAPGLAQQVDAVREAYRSRLTQVTRLIHSKPSAAVRNFARAFNLKGKP